MAGGNRINSKVCKLNNTYSKKIIEEVLEAHEYINHKQDEVCNNYVMQICEDITGPFDYEKKRLKKCLSNAEYNRNIQEYLKKTTEYYGTPDGKGRLHRIGKDQVLMREYVFYLPKEEGDRFRNDETLYRAWCEDNEAWFKQHFPSFKIAISCGHFRGESTPHHHIVFLPTCDEKGGKLANSKFFYDHTKEGAKCCTGAKIQSEREQSYINTVLKKYDIEGGIKGSTATHKDLNEYKSSLTHDIQRLEQQHKELQSMEVEEVCRLYQIEAEHEELKSVLDDLFAQIYNLVPSFARRLMERIADRFIYNNRNNNEIEI